MKLKSQQQNKHCLKLVDKYKRNDTEQWKQSRKPKEATHKSAEKFCVTFQNYITNFSITGKNKKSPEPAWVQGIFILVGEGGFEPPKPVATDLQSAPFDRSGIPPYLYKRK